jgi:3-dehydro-L-gulonate 2-dehydrogenase
MNTNHWMRAGSYARHAASKGFAFIGWTNTIRNTPVWGAIDPRLGNNPLAIGIPFKNDAIVLDMAMSQFSYGVLEHYQMNQHRLPVPGGFDNNGILTDDPGAILESRRTLPVGYWKGSGLSLLLDILATVFSGGLSVSEISKQGEEANISQVFIVFNIQKLKHHSRIPELLQQIINDFHSSVPERTGAEIRYPGEKVLKIRAENTNNGIPVLKKIWDEILALDSH